MRSIDPDSEENQFQARQNEREVFALQMQAKADAERALSVGPSVLRKAEPEHDDAITDMRNNPARFINRAQEIVTKFAQKERLLGPGICDVCERQAPALLMLTPGVSGTRACKDCCGDSWPAPEPSDPAAIAPLCRSGVSIYMRHDIGLDGTCTRCGWRVGGLAHAC